MAALFWVGGTGTYDGTTNHFATTSGGVASVAAPTSSDTVTFDTLSNATAYTVTISATLNCSNLTIGNPLSGLISIAGASALNIYGSSSFPVSNTSCFSGYSGTITYASTATGKTITSNGALLFSPVIGSLIWIGGGSAGLILLVAVVVLLLRR